MDGRVYVRALVSCHLSPQKNVSDEDGTSVDRRKEQKGCAHGYGSVRFCG